MARFPRTARQRAAHRWNRLQENRRGVRASLAAPSSTIGFDFATARSLTGESGHDLTFTRTSSATYYDSSGVLQLAAADSPRFDHNPLTGASRGLLIEGARTNLCKESEDLTTTWIATNATVSANAAVAPDGNTTADKIIPTAVSNTAHYYASGSFVCTAGVQMAMSLYVKPDGMDNVFFAVGGGAFAGEVSVIFDVSAMNVISSDNGTTATYDGFTAEDVGNGWTRVTILVTPSSTSGQMRIGPTTATSVRSGSDGYPAYVPNGTDGAFFWGVQAEVGGFSTSYIPTTTASVTRAADIALVSDMTLFNETVGTLYAAGSLLRGVLDAELLVFDDGTTSERIRLASTNNGGLNKSNFMVSDGGVTQCDLREDNFTVDGVTNRVAGSYSLNDFELYTNGSRSSLGDQVGTLPSGITAMRVGGRAGGVLPWYGWISEIRYYDERRSNADLAQLSTNGELS